MLAHQPSWRRNKLPTSMTGEDVAAWSQARAEGRLSLSHRAWDRGTTPLRVYSSERRGNIYSDEFSKVNALRKGWEGFSCPVFKRENEASSFQFEFVPPRRTACWRAVTAEDHLGTIMLWLSVDESTGTEWRVEAPGQWGSPERQVWSKHPRHRPQAPR